MYLENLGQNACEAKYEISLLDTEKKNAILKKVAEKLVAKSSYIIEENRKDMEEGRKNNMNEGLLDRLMVNEKRIAGISEGIMQVIDLPDPVNAVLDEYSCPNGLKIKKISVPMGVIGIIYESRPNVTADAFALTFKSGNVVILKGGKDAINTNIAIANTIREALKECGVNENAIQLIEKTDRETTAEFMKLNQYVDVLIPRGGKGLIKAVVENSTIPVIETGTGNCHIFVDESADFDMALNIIYNAKTQRIGVCNACESLVIHENILESFIPLLAEKLSEKNVEMRMDEDSIKFNDKGVKAEEIDFYTEYLDYILSVKTVKSVEEAIKHINKYNTGHSESIITNSTENADKFLKGVDAACVYVNASTRFTDGFEFGLGAEIGISTQKLHARGPMGLKELTSYKYTIEGNGQIRG